MQKIILLQYEQYFHIYNCGINGERLFREKGGYEHFLKLYNKYIEPVADTFAWCLMSNHFHLLVRIKKSTDITTYKPFNTDRSIDTDRLKGRNNPSVFNAPDGIIATAICNAPDGIIATATCNAPDGIIATATCNAPDGIIATATNDVQESIIGNKIKLPSPDKYFSHLFNAYARYFNIRHGRHGSLFERPFKRKLINNEIYLRNLVVYIHNNPVHHGFCNVPEDYTWSSYNSILSDKPTKLKRSEVINWFGDVENFQFAHKQKVDIIEMERWLDI